MCATNTQQFGTIFFPRPDFSNSPGCLGTHAVDQAGLELIEVNLFCLLSAGIKACTTTAWFRTIVYPVMEKNIVQCASEMSVPSPFISLDGSEWDLREKQMLVVQSLKMVPGTKLGR